jgi:alkyldihydroxyacetonephosphate synthase
VRSRGVCERHGAFALGRATGRRWYARRFTMPYLRDPLLDRGVAVETLETAVRWADLDRLYLDLGAAIREALAQHPADAQARAIVMAHISHVYADGASLYFTMVFPQPRADTPQASAAAAAEQWQHVKTAACEAIAAAGGTISHHHGVGTDHAPWLAREKGPVGFDLLSAVKRDLDPDDTMNPGKLVTKG